MKTVKNLLLGVLLSVGLSMPALASESQSGSQDSLTDVSLVFESNDAKLIQLAPLSSQEMKQTGGAWLYHTALHGHWQLGGVRWHTTYHRKFFHHSFLFGGA